MTLAIRNLCEITTERLIIRPVRVGDVAAFQQLIDASQPRLKQTMPWVSDWSLQGTRAWVQKAADAWQAPQGSGYYFALLEKETRALIGRGGYNESSDFSVSFVELSIWIGDAYEGQGYASEMVSALTQYAFEVLKVQYVQAVTQHDNARGNRLFARYTELAPTLLKNNIQDAETGEGIDDHQYRINSLPKTLSCRCHFQHENLSQNVSVLSSSGYFDHKAQQGGFSESICQQSRR